MVRTLQFYIVFIGVVLIVTQLAELAAPHIAYPIAFLAVVILASAIEIIRAINRLKESLEKRL